MHELTVLPWLQRLQTVDQTAVETIRCRCQDDKHKADVGPPQAWILIPGDLRELAFRQAESALRWTVHDLIDSRKLLDG